MRKLSDEKKHKKTYLLQKKGCPEPEENVLTASRQTFLRPWTNPEAAGHKFPAAGDKTFSVARKYISKALKYISKPLKYISKAWK